MSSVGGPTGRPFCLFEVGPFPLHPIPLPFRPFGPLAFNHLGIGCGASIVHRQCGVQAVGLMREGGLFPPYDGPILGPGRTP